VKLLGHKKYELTPNKIKNGVMHSSHGVLLKFSDGFYSLYHPIEILGDMKLNDFLKNMNEENPVFKRVSEAALNKNSFESLKGKKILCYQSEPHIDNLRKGSDRLLNSGFRSVKVKASKLSQIKPYVKDLETLNLKYILDFNSQENLESFENADDVMKAFLNTKVKYIEDPCETFPKNPYFKVASDFVDYSEQEDYRILKPTNFNLDLLPIKNKDTFVVTSYLDHPFGQLMAAHFALNNDCSQECGLLSHTYYKKNPFSELLSEGPYFELDCADDFFDLLDKTFKV
jgi:hypothetical protein